MDFEKKYNAYPEALPMNNYGSELSGNGPPVYGQPLYPDDVQGNPKLNRFVKQGMKDVWAAVLFLVAVIATVIVGFYNLAVYQPIEGNSTGTNVSTMAPNDSLMNNYSAGYLALILAATFGASIFLSCFSLFLLNLYPKKLIIIANIFTIFISLGSACLAFIAGSIFFGIVMLLLAGFQALWLYMVRDRIPFSAALLQTASGILSRHKTLVGANFLFGVVSFIYLIIWSGAILPPADRISSQKGKSTDGFVLLIFIFILFWFLQVIPNLSHVTSSGVAATWYFAGEHAMPRSPVFASVKRAITTSLGSVCFGSLLVAFIQFIRFLIDMNRENENGFIRCIALCILGCIESLLEYFNQYAFVHIAIYGCGYIEAAKRTWGLCKQCAFAACFNDALVGPTLTFLSIAVSAVLGIIIGFATRSIGFGIVAFIISLLIHSLFFAPVHSIVTTLFVCFAEEPDVLRQSSPDLYAALYRTDNGETNNNALHP